MDLGGVESRLKGFALRGGREPEVYIIPLGQRGDGSYEVSKLEYNLSRRMVSFARMSGVDLNDYHPVCAWRYGGMIYKKK